MSYRKNVFLLGAGASMHAGAPVMKDFLQVAEDIAGEGLLSDEETRRLRSVFDFRASVETAEPKAGLDLTNLEDLFGLVDVHCRVNPEDPKARELRRDFIFLILKTLDTKIQEEQSVVSVRTQGGNEPLEFDRKASEHFVDMVARRWSKPPLDQIARDSIITLNYDLLIDRALKRHGLIADYCLSSVGTSESEDTRVKLLKLHGSGGWALCQKCETVDLFWEASSTKVPAPPCSRCGEHTEVLIVPPTWSKGDYPKALDQVWKAAFEELKSASRLVLIYRCIDA